jgi:hypothetical protein
MSGSQGANSRGGRYRAFEGTRFVVCGYEGADREALVERIDALGGFVLSRSQRQHQTPHVVVCGNVNDATYRVSWRRPREPIRIGGWATGWPLRARGRIRKMAATGGSPPRTLPTLLRSRFLTVSRRNSSPPRQTTKNHHRRSRPSTTRSPPS